MQVVFAHPPHRCSPSSGDRQPTLFVAGYGRMVSAFFKGQNLPLRPAGRRVFDPFT